MNKQEKLIENEFEEVTSTEQQYWKPTIESEIQGTIIRRQKSTFGMSYVIETKEGAVVLPNHVVLEGLLNKCDIGDKVKIICYGAEPNKKGNNTLLYKLFVSRH